MTGILTIVGSQNLTLHQELEVKSLCNKEIFDHQPTKIYSGGAIGVDTLAIKCANALEIPWEEIVPTDEDMLYEGFARYKPRNMKLAAICDRLVCIRSKQSRTYGSGWTADYAEKLGKNVERFTV